MDGVWYEQRVKHGSQVEILALSLRSFGLESLPMIAARSVSYNYGLHVVGVLRSTLGPNIFAGTAFGHPAEPGGGYAGVE